MNSKNAWWQVCVCLEGGGVGLNFLYMDSMKVVNCPWLILFYTNLVGLAVGFNECGELPLIDLDLYNFCCNGIQSHNTSCK